MIPKKRTAGRRSLSVEAPQNKKGKEFIKNAFTEPGIKFLIQLHLVEATDRWRQRLISASCAVPHVSSNVSWNRVPVDSGQSSPSSGHITPRTCPPWTWARCSTPKSCFEEHRTSANGATHADKNCTTRKLHRREGRRRGAARLPNPCALTIGRNGGAARSQPDPRSPEGALPSRAQ